MGLFTHATRHVDSCDGRRCQEILQTQQTSVRIVTFDGDAVRTGWVFGVFAYTIPIVGKVPLHRGLPLRCRRVPTHGFPLYLDRYSADARRTTCGEAS